MSDARRILPALSSAMSAAAAGASVDAMGDAAYPAWYRRRLAAALLRRSLAQAFEGAGNA